MVTGYEVEMYANIKRIAVALERIAKALEQAGDPSYGACQVHPDVHALADDCVGFHRV